MCVCVCVYVCVCAYVCVCLSTYMCACIMLQKLFCKVTLYFVIDIKLNFISIIITCNLNNSYLSDVNIIVIKYPDQEHKLYLSINRKSLHMKTHLPVMSI